MEGFEAKLVENVVVIEFDHGCVLATTVNDAGDFICATQAAARTRALYATRSCFQSDFHIVTPS
jgi:hypothetical protein